jgi:PPOX class probable F420-dependent enzyme
VEETEVRHRLEASFVARLATVGVDGRPHIVPITFALEDQTLYFAVDFKPKRTTNLKRLANIATNPEVSVLIDHYESDWDRLWWVRLDGTARIVTELGEVEHALNLLALRYKQYRETRPAGPAVAITIERMTGWSAAG